jgi:hypothetical protein
VRHRRPANLLNAGDDASFIGDHHRKTRGQWQRPIIDPRDDASCIASPDARLFWDFYYRVDASGLCDPGHYICMSGIISGCTVISGPASFDPVDRGARTEVLL